MRVSNIRMRVSNIILSQQCNSTDYKYERHVCIGTRVKNGYPDLRPFSKLASLKLE